MPSFKDNDKDIAKRTAIAKAQHSGKPSDFPFRTKRGGGIVGVVTAQPDGTYRTTALKDKK